MSRGRKPSPSGRLEQRHQDFVRTVPLRQMHPHLAEVRVKLEFQDGSPQPPSPQSFCYFPAARGFFRYSCPCFACTGEFDLTDRVAQLARRKGGLERSDSLEVNCEGQRSREVNEPAPCPMRARVVIEAVAHSKENRDGV